MKDVVEEGNEVFVVMEFIDGQTLNHSLDKRFDLKDFLSIATQCASALAAAHKERVVHLDIKPENIMLTPSQKVKICDFGLAHQLEIEDNERSGVSRWTFAGTPSYMAPEVLESNQFDGRADVFALGVVFHQMLSGRHPFKSDDVRTTTNRILKEEVPSLSQIDKKLPSRLTRLVDRMLLKQPSRRPDSAEVVRELQSIRRHAQFLADTWRSFNELAVNVARKPLTFVVLFAVLIAAVSLAYLQPRSTAAGVTPFPEKKYVAVLPFRVFGNMPAGQLYAQGITEMLTDRLMRITAVPNLQIASPSLMHEDNIDSVEKAYGELGATIVVSGLFQFSGDKATYSYYLIRASDNTVLRAPITRTLSFNDQFAFQDAVIKDVAARLEIELAPGPGFGTKNPKALARYTEAVGALTQAEDEQTINIAIDLFEDAIQLDGDYAAAFAGLGEAYLQQFALARQTSKLLEEAQSACDKAVRLDPRRSDAEVCLGRVHEEQGDNELAVESYRRAIEYSAANDNAFMALGSVLESMNRFDDAEKAYLWAIELRPTDWAPHSWIGSFYNARHQYAKAIDEYNAALHLSKENAKVSYSIGNAYVNYGLYEMAIKSYQAAMRRRPYSAPPYSNLGLSYLRWRNYKEAVGFLEKAVSLDSNGDHRITGNLARIYWLMGRKDDARAKYETAIEQAMKELHVNANRADVHVLVGRYQAMLGRTATAVSHLDQAYRIRPADPHYQLIGATAYAVMGNHKKALDLIEEAVRLGYRDTQIHAEPELDVLKSEPRFMALLVQSSVPAK